MPVKFWHTSLRFRFFLSYLITTVSSILPTRHFESNWHLAIIYIILNWNVRLYLCYSGNDMEILTYKSGGFQPRIPKSTYSCSFWWIYFLVHSILPTKNPILTSLQCINQVIFRMIGFSIIGFESQVLFQMDVCIYWMLLSQSNNRYIKASLIQKLVLIIHSTMQEVDKIIFPPKKLRR